MAEIQLAEATANREEDTLEDARVEPLLDLIRQGRGIIRACTELGICPEAFRRRFRDDEDFRVNLVAADYSLDEAIREVLFHLALGGNLDAIRLFLDLRRQNLELAQMAEKHSWELRAIIPARPDPAAVTRAVTTLASKVTEFLPAELGAELVRAISETLAEVEACSDLRPRPALTTKIALPYWADDISA